MLEEQGAVAVGVRASLIIQQRFPEIKLSVRVWLSFRPLTSEQECVGWVSAAAREADDELPPCQWMSYP